MSARSIHHILTIVSSLSILLPLTLSFFRFKAFNKQLWALFFYFVIDFVNEVVCYILSANNINNVFCFEIFNLLEGLFMVYVYAEQLHWTSKTRALLFSLVLLLCAGPHMFPGISIDVSNTGVFALVIIFSIITFYRLFIELNIPLLSNYYFFWINSAFLFYFGTTILLSIFGNFIRTGGNLGTFLWTIHLFANITRNIVISEGIWQIRKT